MGIEVVAPQGVHMETHVAKQGLVAATSSTPKNPLANQEEWLATAMPNGNLIDLSFQKGAPPHHVIGKG